MVLGLVYAYHRGNPRWSPCVHIRQTPRKVRNTISTLSTEWAVRVFIHHLLSKQLVIQVPFQIEQMTLLSILIYIYIMYAYILVTSRNENDRIDFVFLDIHTYVYKRSWIYPYKSNGHLLWNLPLSLRDIFFFFWKQDQYTFSLNLIYLRPLCIIPYIYISEYLNSDIKA